MGTLKPGRNPTGKDSGDIIISHTEELAGYLFHILVIVIDDDNRVMIVEEPSGKGGDPPAPERDTARDMAAGKPRRGPDIKDLTPVFLETVHFGNRKQAEGRGSVLQRDAIPVVPFHGTEVRGQIR